MAERNGQERTEKPTGKRRSDARKRGNAFQSKDVNTVVMLLGVFIVVRLTMPHIYTTIRGYLVQITTGTGGDVAQLLSSQLLAITIISLPECVLPLLLTAVVLGILSHGAQTCFNVAFQALQPRFNKLNPITGIRSLFSLKKVVKFLKNLIKIPLLLAFLYNLLKGDIVSVAGMTDMNPFSPVAYMMNVVFNLAIKICMALTVVAFFDSLYQRWEYEQDLKMTEQEVKDKYKQTGGSPEIKGRIRRIQRQMAPSRMTQKISQADVIVRNPTHFAVVFKYDPGKSSVPIVLAKGQDELALRIIKVGKESGIAVIENRLPARVLYTSCELDWEIPVELYGAVVEILVFIYKASHREDMFR